MSLLGRQAGHPTPKFGRSLFVQVVLPVENDFGDSCTELPHRRLLYAF
jgi:hypothetical protein